MGGCLGFLFIFYFSVDQHRGDCWTYHGGQHFGALHSTHFENTVRNNQREMWFVF
ncbi:hypothetical protein KC19_VG213700 [Ceratodon purpureus]|uniref:Uncharacterized protein n=1 Tax=Ceratodon purpureus TaxID=3225 RepID=A0A8T0HSR3_CERPU|nr:hypothetical protein KC19_VG213700 [Ceratodon purpureus]